MKTKTQAYRPNKSAGYDAASRRWRTADGKIVKKSEFTGAIAPSQIVEHDGGGGLSGFIKTPLSDAFSRYDEIQRGGVGFNEFLASAVQTPQPMPVPTEIRSAMALAEYYTNTCGDIFQHIEAPIDVGMTDLQIDSPDPGFARDLELLYSERYYDMWNTLYQAWLCTAIYGSAYPFEVPEANKIVLLPPRYVWVGYYVNYGEYVPPTETQPSPYGMNPPDGSAEWSLELVKTTFMPASYNTFGALINEQILKTWGLPLPQEYLHPIRAKALSWQRYPRPPLSRAFNSLANRVVLDEAVRATIEGVKNQLWVFKLGSENRQATAKEVKVFSSLIENSAQDRAGYLVFKAPFEVEQHTPKSFDSMLASETRQEFTLRIFRDIGSNIRIVSGNPVTTGRAEGTSIEFDISLWLTRLEWPRRSLMRWEHEFRKRMVERMGSAAAMKANEQTTVRFSKSLLEVSERIKNELQPLYSIGLTSSQTTLDRAGYNYRAELARKQQEQPNDYLFQPRSTFSQTFRPDDGSAPTTTESTSTGRPPDVMAEPKQEMTASKQTWDEKKRIAYFAEVYATIRELMRSGKTDEFVDALGRINAEYLPEFADDSYHMSGGSHHLVGENAQFAVDYVNKFLPGFKEALKANGADPSDPAFERRAMMYPQEGFRLAVMNGQRQALKERGARKWRRILGESKSGPCAICAEDAKHTHDIDEPFTEFHPSGTCSQQFLQFSMSDTDFTEIPVPSDRDLEYIRRRRI